MPTNGPGPTGRQGGYTVSLHELSHVVPKKAKVEGDKGEKARVAGRTEEAILHLEQAVALDPEYTAARNNLAIVYLVADKVDLGIAQLEKAIQIDPHNPALFLNLAIGHLLAGNFPAGEWAARESINLNRANAQAQILLGLALIHQEKFTEETVRSLEMAKDEYPAIRLNLAFALIRRGNLAQAKSELETYVAGGDTQYRAQATSWLDKINDYQRRQTASQTDTSRPN